MAPVFADTSPQQTNNSLFRQLTTGDAHSNPFGGAVFEIGGGVANKGKSPDYNWNSTTNYTVSFAANDTNGNRVPLRTEQLMAPRATAVAPALLPPAGEALYAFL